MRKFSKYERQKRHLPITGMVRFDFFIYRSQSKEKDTRFKIEGKDTIEINLKGFSMRWEMKTISP